MKSLESENIQKNWTMKTNLLLVLNDKFRSKFLLKKVVEGDSNWVVIFLKYPITSITPWSCMALFGKNILYNYYHHLYSMLLFFEVVIARIDDKFNKNLSHI